MHLSQSVGMCIPQSCTPCPIEGLQLPQDLSGVCGTNRGQGRKLIAATDDRQAVLAWLAMYQGSPATFAAYRKEAERLLLWCVIQLGKPLSSLTHEDMLAYRHFLSQPSPAHIWVMPGGFKAPRNSPHWRPFAADRLEWKSVVQGMRIINGMFNWLVEAGYLAGNPVALHRIKSPSSAAPVVTRYLPKAYWAEVLATITQLPTATPRDRKVAARARWFLALLYGGGLRVSEAIQARMGDAYKTISGQGVERWWLSVTGKGGKTRLVPLTPPLLKELEIYRVAIGLSPRPTAAENTPLVASVRGGLNHINRSAAHDLIKHVMSETAERLRSRGLDGDQEMADHIEQASCHWLRHTAASHQLMDGVNLKTAQENLGHANLATLSIYAHEEHDRRHDQTAAAHASLFNFIPR